MGELRDVDFYREHNIPPQTKPGFHQPDRVRLQWEDELIQYTLKPHLKKLTQGKDENTTPQIRVLELGLPNLRGYRLLSELPEDRSQLDLDRDYILPAEQVGLYLGIEKDYTIVEQANHVYRHQKKVRFIRHDYSQGLGMFKLESPFDIYLSHYGRWSRLKKDQLANILVDLIDHAQNGSLIVFDVKGKYALNPIKPLSQKTQVFWGRREMLKLLLEINKQTSGSLETLAIRDRSILINSGDRPDIHPAARSHINRLLSPFQRTDLRELLINLEDLPQAMPKKVMAFYEYFAKVWNLFVQYAITRFETPLIPQELQDWDQFPPALQFGILTLDRLIQDTQWIAYGDTRANIIEPHIAYALRNLEFELQKGLGCGQFLQVLLRVNKPQ